ncbi:2-dehydropantoate 2-reductase N-terminal domain-containing protein [Ralstonia solanacearum]|uniref:2-dehydropantoate 2-reductase n=1 Tax=Ralstonia solanacearum (strain Po82) TaxID=1031711 RepID=F6G822_RALS8|nr:2-dehydropantoate 2-reductase N-terminal domain-containing protein [Ralstonia solanacearum]AEG70698.1 2-dehydropantoate 2-reductase [Ralstonia solanacearum Po82]AMP71106.1 hypothetical protein UW163_16245 [Ralstonia solanacearum]AMP76976.1 hypothetical protein RALBFv3_23000 [Ralstonia solanacearum]EUJ13369.1 hypothetical protein RSP673_16500 [Ralstonia solanacearum P673]MCG3575038.1 2-dehydropantoate 2-reductase [Ralstonia solanacearum]
MRILVVGAGAVGGYFGGRLLVAGCDVTFLERPCRATALATGGLVIRSPHGDATIAQPPTVVGEHLYETYDVVLLCCHAQELYPAIHGSDATR